MTNAEPAPGIADRLRKVAATRSISAIARDTGTPFATVHRFLQGGRATADFCARVVDAYGLNASWLLGGSGPMYVESRPTESHATPAGDILELIESMNALSRVRLGVLDGRHHARVLRGLNDTLERYETLRGELNSRSASVLKDLAAGINKAIDEAQVERAHDLAQSGEQVLRLGGDEAATHAFLSARTRLAYYEADWQAALQLQQRLMRDSFIEGSFANDESCIQLGRTVHTLQSCGRWADAQRLFEAGLILARGGSLSPRARAQLAWVGGQINAEGLNLHRSLELLPMWAAQAKSEGRGWLSVALQIRLLGGQLGVCDAVVLCGPDAPALMDPLEFCLWTEQRKDAEFLIPHLTGLDFGHLREGKLTLDAITLLVRGPRRGRTALQAWQHVQVMHANTGARGGNLELFGAAILARYGERKQAEKHWQQIAPRLATRTGFPIAYRAAAHRATLRLFGRARRRRKEVVLAREFFETALNEGYEAFRPWFEGWLQGRDLSGAPNHRHSAER